MKDKKGLILSITGLSLAFLAMFFTTYAWFAISSSVSNDMIGLNVTDGIFPSYEIHYYTYEHVYKYDQSSGDILVYDSGDWVSPSYEFFPESAYPFQGIMIDQYDPLIPENNEYDSIIVGFHLYCDVNHDTNISILGRSDTDMATDAITSFGETRDIHYLSQVSYLQEMSTSAYDANPEGTNIYLSLKSDFETLDGNDDLLYPLNYFYDEYDAYVTETSLGSFSLTSSTTDIYLYFNLSYNDLKIEDILTSAGAGSTLASLPAIRFYQDIEIIVEEAGGS